MKKYLPLAFFAFLSITMFPQMIPVPGQPAQGQIRTSVKANEDIAFYIYYGQNNQPETVYALYGNQLTEISWTNTPTNFDPHYRGQLGGKYYFRDIINSDGFLYEYDHNSKNTRKIPLPTSYSCDYLPLLSDEFNGKIYYVCGYTVSKAEAIIGFDGNVFEVFPLPSDYSIFNNTFMYFSELDEILIWFVDGGSQNAGSQLYSFDGANVTHIPNPNTNLLAGLYGIPFDNHIILPYVEDVGGIDQKFYFYKYDGSNLVPFTGMPSTIFHNLQVFESDDKLYFSLSNYSSLTSSLYEYDGIDFNEIFNSTYYNPLFLTKFNGKDMFSIYSSALNSSGLYSYDGNTLEYITGAVYPQTFIFRGSLNNKLYLSHYNTTTTTNDLYSYSIGDTQLQPVPNMPAGDSYRAFHLKYNNTLLHSFKKADYEYKMFEHDQNDQFRGIDPQNYNFNQLDFQLGNTVFFTYYTSDWMNQKIFMWNEVLSTPNYSSTLNDIVIYPNPSSDNIYVEIPNELSLQSIEISVFSIDGKMVYKQSVENSSSQLEISLEDLKSGVYILELKGENTTVRNKIIRK